MEYLELKNTIIKIKNSMNALYSRMKETEEKISGNSKIEQWKLPKLNKRENKWKKN